MTTINPAIEQAMASVAAAASKAAADPTRPVFHFCPPAYWMNDPNGTFYHNGYYHLFYQHNPYGDEWGHIHWGHTRSRDLVYWEHLPIALWPSLEQEEEHVFSGCAALNDQGQPVLIYTSVKQGPRENRPPNHQWAALGDADWITWQKHPQNPILALESHGGPPFEGDWRDPYIFHEAGRTFMVVAGAYADIAAVGLYEATDGTLARWIYRGLLYHQPRTVTRFFECPNFIKLGNRWLLLSSPYKPIEYISGVFDVTTLTFTPQQQGVLDAGFSDVPNYYASNTLWDAQGRCILLGWVRGFAKERGWNGCLALPRILTLSADGHPRQLPHPDLQKLRGQGSHFTGITLSNQGHRLAGIQGDTLEMQATLEPGSAQAVGLKVRQSADGQQSVLIRYDGRTLHVAGTEVPFALEAGETQLQLHLFLDRSVLEIFVNQGRVAMTRVIYPPAEDRGVEVFAEGGNAQIRTLSIWQMQAIG